MPRLLVLALVLLPFLASAQETPPSGPRVTVAAAVMQDVVQDASFIGRVEAVDSTAIVPRVSGFVRNIAVANGAAVSAGDLLVEVEPDQYAATVAVRRAELSSAEANRALAEVELARRRELVSRQAVAQSELDVALANAQAAEAAVQAAEAALRMAELDLSYTRITAPFDGRLGRIAVSLGELVGPGTGALVTLVREAPVFVRFSLDERQFYDTLAQVAEDGEDINTTAGRLDVTLRLPNGGDFAETGRIAFGDNRVDPATGTLAVRAESENAERMLVDGAFVTARLAQREPVPMLTIPQAAVQRDQSGPFVLVVGSEQTVEQRRVETGQQVGPSVVVTEGLREGETVIVEGLQRVRPGVPVEAVFASSGN
jgi:membrane fusion protein (multidrug efflux system)